MHSRIQSKGLTNEDLGHCLIPALRNKNRKGRRSSFKRPSSKKRFDKATAAAEEEKLAKKTRKSGRKKFRRLNMDYTPDPRCPHCDTVLKCNSVFNVLSERSCDYKTTYDGGFGYKMVDCGHCGAILGAFSTSTAATNLPSPFKRQQ